MGLWKDIKKEACTLKQNCELCLENGMKIRFWEDALSGRRPLSEVFLGLYSVASSKGVWVANLWVVQEGSGAWNPKFSRPFSAWDLSLSNSLSTP